jgi:hypothetical protein
VPVAIKNEPSNGVVSLSKSLPNAERQIASSTCALALLRFRSTATTLRDRVSFAVVPADEFDPDSEAVLRFAAQLARLDRSVRGWLDRRASAIHIRLEADGEGRLVYLLEVPGRLRELLLRSTLRSYERVELRGPADVRRSGGAEGEGNDPTQLTATARAELVLARPSVEPLGRVTIDPDPLGPCAAAMRALRCADGEEGVVCVDLLPAVPSSRLGHRRGPRCPEKGYGECRSLCIEASSSVPGPRAFTRRWGHLLMWAATVAPLRQECERKSARIRGNPRDLSH